MAMPLSPELQAHIAPLPWWRRALVRLLLLRSTFIIVFAAAMFMVARFAHWLYAEFGAAGPAMMLLACLIIGLHIERRDRAHR